MGEGENGRGREREREGEKERERERSYMYIQRKPQLKLEGESWSNCMYICEFHAYTCTCYMHVCNIPAP